MQNSTAMLDSRVDAKMLFGFLRIKAKELLFALICQ